MSFRTACLLLQSPPSLGRTPVGRVHLVRLLRPLLASFVWFASAAPVAALPVTLTLVPSSPSVGVGQTLSVDVVVGGLVELEGGGEIALESFDLDLAFDTSRLAFTSLSYGPALGDPEDGAETFVSGPGSPNATGVALLFEFSFLTEAQLLALQAAPFTLATLQFQALALPGSALLALVNLDGSSLGGVAGRALGDELAAPSALSVEVVPEPGMLALAAAALLALGRRRARG
jgi:MYXO-CTERM domain-containing protein